MLDTYLRRFQQLRVARSTRHGEAPYKPALLLAVLDGIAAGDIQDNRIAITPELIAAFTAICTDLGSSPHFTANNFALPYYHLGGEGFWQLHTWPRPGAVAHQVQLGAQLPPPARSSSLRLAR
jgi:putative restriction endonuclease